MKILKNVLVILTTLSGLITFSIPFISSYMQDLIKSQMPASEEKTIKLLEQKRIWVQIGESKFLLYIFLFLLVLLLTSFITIWVKNKK